jgi:hypothetical protein
MRRNLPLPPKRYQDEVDTPPASNARQRVEAAIEAVGPYLIDILLQVVVCDLPIATEADERARSDPRHAGPLHSARGAGRAPWSAPLGCLMRPPLLCFVTPRSVLAAGRSQPGQGNTNEDRER